MTIHASNLHFNYGRHAVLHDITATFASKRITAVIGPNAAGKSTLLRCLIGALKPSRGTVDIDGIQVRSLSVRQLARRMAYVPQRSVVSAAFTVRQVVELGRFALPFDADRIEDALRRLDIADVSDRPYLHLSVGQQQRVAMARAVAQLETYGHLILDEPTAAMDLRHANSCMRLLRVLANGGATVVLAIHDLTLAAAVADACVLLNQGRLVAAGETKDVLSIDRLESVFGAPFEFVQTSDRGTRLVPRSPAS